MRANNNATASVTPELSPKEPPSKVVVAQSDFDSVLHAIDGVMESEVLKSRAEGKATETSNNNETNERDDDRMEVDERDEFSEKDMVPTEREESDNPKVVFLSHVHTSLKERLYQIVQPISDEEFHLRARGYIIKEQILEENEEEHRVIVREEAALKAQEEAQRRAEEARAQRLNNDYDDHELMDQEALKRARELRDQVRVTAMQRRQQQDAIIERAVQLAQREIRLLTKDILMEQEQEDAITTDKNGQQSMTNNMRQHILEQTKVSLQALTSSLSSTGSTLQRNIQDLRDTVNTIHKSLQKKEQPLAMSKTEQAILSRANEGSYDLATVSEDDGEDSVLVELDNFNAMKNPEFILADFLSKY